MAGWMRFVAGTDEAGRPIDVRDPMAAELARIAGAAGPVAERLAPTLLALPVFVSLGGDPQVRRSVTGALARLYAVGARRAVR